MSEYFLLRAQHELPLLFATRHPQRQCPDPVLRVVVYRPGMIGGATDTGYAQPEQFLARFMTTCLQLGVFPTQPTPSSEDLNQTNNLTLIHDVTNNCNVDGAFEMLPVDFMAEAIVRYASAAIPFDSLHCTDFSAASSGVGAAVAAQAAVGSMAAAFARAHGQRAGNVVQCALLCAWYRAGSVGEVPLHGHVVHIVNRRDRIATFSQMGRWMKSAVEARFDDRSLTAVSFAEFVAAVQQRPDCALHPLLSFIQRPGFFASYDRSSCPTTHYERLIGDVVPDFPCVDASLIARYVEHLMLLQMT
eukprot:TRINITY_DN2973_c0_g4_i1.p1 TRINITY_DN2973_c0_g4~~TRINITY_DN2973_c0_g4_i1.p1  ORF type:complete len:303 (+),score=38.79 TRINITY_DN2973_c0_g4_i1:178-1086(+)